MRTLTWEGIEFGSLILITAIHYFIIEISPLKILCRRHLQGVIS